jgi:hypothetical protein
MRKRKKKKRYYMILMLVLLVGLGGFGVWKYIENEHKHMQVVSGLPSDLGTKKLSDKEIKKYADKKVNASQVTMEVYPEIIIGSDGKSGNLWIHNAPTNKLGQQATLFDEDSKELSKTGLMKPGYQVDTVKLDRALSKGKHKGTVQLTFYNLEQQKEVGRTSVDVEIDVK